ncbi:MAG: hypothetical protein AB7O91_07345 [Sphingomonas sp.]
MFKRDWLWLTHNWDPFAYVSSGRVRAVGQGIDGWQLIRIDLDFRLPLLILVAFAALIYLLAPSFGALAAALFFLTGLLSLVTVPRRFLAKLKWLLDTSGSN